SLSNTVSPGAAMASGMGVWAVALTSDPVRKMAVSTAFLGNDTVVLRYWFSRACFNRVESGSSIIFLCENESFRKTGVHFSGSCPITASRRAANAHLATGCEQSIVPQ